LYYRNGQHEKAADPVRSASGLYSAKRHRSSKLKIILLLGTVVAIETVLVLVLFIQMSLLDQENLALALAEKKHAAELAELQPQLEKLRKDLAEMTLSRLPGLTPLEFDKVIPVEDRYVKNIVFTLAGKGDDKSYEFKIVTHNATLTLIHPQVDVLFFDRAGIQVGVARIGVQPDGTPTLDVLDRGEIRSFSSKIELADDAAPAYFRLKLGK
jgi:hypothetical protein